MTVYADLLFLINFSIDYVALYITGRLMSCRSTALRLSAASAIGALFAVGALILDAHGVMYLIASAAVTAGMCVCAYKKAGFCGYVGASVLLFCVGAAIGGVVSAIMSLGSGASEQGGEGAASDGDVAGIILFLLLAGASALVFNGGRIAKRRALTMKRRIVITNNGSSVELEALCDSGNLLREPISGRSAVIIGANSLRGVLPDEIINAVKAEGADAAATVSRLPESVLGRVRMLPSSGVDGSKLLIGYRPDDISIITDKKRRSVDGIIALVSEQTFAGCDAVLPLEFI